MAKKKTKKLTQKQMVENRKRLILRGLAMACAILAAADFIIHRHAYFALEATPLFFALMGAGSMVLVTALSLGLRKLAIRPANYYEPPKAKKGGKNA